MVKAIIFDFWGTLAEQGIWSPVKQIKNILNIDLSFPEYINRMERVFMGQKHNGLKEAFECVCQEFGITPEKEKIEEMIGLWNKSWMLAKPYPETETTLSELKEKYKIVLISNTDCFSLNQVLEKFQMAPLFDELFFSHQLNLIKTDKLFLKQVLIKLNLTPSECVVVGDSIQSDIIPAKRWGMNAVLIDRKNTRNYHPKIKTLTDLDKLL